MASGDLRLSVNVRCWPTQEHLEADFTAAVERRGWSVERAVLAKPALFAELGLEVHVCGDVAM